MTKVVLDILPDRGARSAIGPADLARRFEWRLQWEKSQLKDWQAYRQVGVQRTPGEGPQTERSESGDEAIPGIASQPCLRSDQLFDVTESGPSHGLEKPQRRLCIEPLPKNNSIPERNSITVAEATTLRSVSVSPRTVRSVRATPMPLSRQAQFPGMHIYQMDGKVEVALRNAGLRGKEGEKLIAGLRRDLASLGLRLARLTLNGELLWQSDSTATQDGSATEAQHGPIDRTY